MKKINEETLTAIMLCDPITRKGKRYLRELDLNGKITPEFYYKHLRVKSKFEDGFFYELDNDSDVDDTETKRKKETQYYEIKGEYYKFVQRFKSNNPDTCPLLLVGVAGNGKTIEINRQLWELKNDKGYDYLYFDLEEVDTEPFYATDFICPDPDNPIWLLCTKLLDGIMKYLLDNSEKCIDLFNNYKCKLNCTPAFLGDDKHDELFAKIAVLNIKEAETVRDVFNSLKNFVNIEDPGKSTKAVLRILLYIVYCSCPQNKHYIVFDNIESFIKTNRKNIHIPDGTLIKIYSIIRYTTQSVIKQFDKISRDLGWTVFKIIVVVRRTSIDLLEPRHVQDIALPKENIADLTGHFQIDDIWEKKTKHTDGYDNVWDMVSKTYLPDEDNEKIIGLADIILTHRKKASGWSYQSMIAPLMSYGIRRTAKAQAHAIMCTYRELSNGSDTTINYNSFLKLYELSQSKTDKNSGTISKMMRRALIEQQFKWAIYHLDKDDFDSDYDELTRWSALGIGHLKCDRNGRLTKKKCVDLSIKVSEVVYRDDNNVTLLRRILTALSYYPDKNTRVGEKTAVKMFNTISLYELMKDVLLTPKGRENENNGNHDLVKLSCVQLRPFARVLLALCNMSNKETKSAPYVILNIKNYDFHSRMALESEDIVFAGLLLKIWNKGENASREGKYNRNNYGARITAAGYSFLTDWLSSFSFFASLYCYDIAPLFFLKDTASIKYVIRTVYDSATDLRLRYEREAQSFCGKHTDLKDKMYLPRIEGKEKTFPSQIKQMHIEHLRLYKTYLEKNYKTLGFTEDNISEVLDFVGEYIEKYRTHYLSGGTTLCF